MRSGWLRGSIYWVLLVWGSVCVSRTIIPDAQEHFLTPSAHRDTHLFGGLGLTRWFTTGHASTREDGMMSFTGLIERSRDDAGHRPTAVEY